MIFQLQIFCSMEYLERELSNESTGYSRDKESMETASFAILVEAKRSLNAVSIIDQPMVWLEMQERSIFQATGVK